MTAVKDKLTGRQYQVHGVNEKGQPRSMYMSNEVEGLTHINLGGKEIYVDSNTLIEVVGLLKNGDDFMERLNKARHKRETDHEEQ